MLIPGWTIHIQKPRDFMVLAVGYPKEQGANRDGRAGPQLLWKGSDSELLSKAGLWLSVEEHPFPRSVLDTSQSLTKRKLTIRLAHAHHREPSSLVPQICANTLAVESRKN